MADPDIRSAVFDELRTAELNELYYRSRAANFAWWDDGSRILSLALGTASVAGWLGNLDAAAWKVFSVVSVVASIVTMVLKYGERARMSREMAARWTGVVSELRYLDRAAREGRVDAARFEQVLQRAEEIQGLDLEPPDKGRQPGSRSGAVQRSTLRHPADAAVAGEARAASPSAAPEEVTRR